MLRCCGVIVMAITLASTSPFECLPNQDHRTDKKHGVFAESIVLSGTRTLDSTEMSSIIGQLSGSCFDEQGDQIANYVRDQFQQRGYMRARVEHVRVRPSDPLTIPKPATIEADVTEGPLYHIGGIRFEGNSAFSSEELTALFPFKAGSIYSSLRLRSGINALRGVYGSAGYIDTTFVSDADIASDQVENPTVLIKISFVEGSQYHMGKVQVAGPTEQVSALQSRWALQEGLPFDGAYPHKFLVEYKELLPADFQERQALRIVRNCRDATVDVSIVLDWRFAPVQPAGDIGCEKPPKPKA